YGPGVLQSRTVFQGGHLSNDPTQSSTFGWSLTRLVFTAADGTEYELRDVQTGGQAHDARTNNNQPYSRGTVFVTADGSSATFVSDAPITETFQFGDTVYGAPSGFLLLADGTRYCVVDGGVRWIRDRNGNRIKYESDGTR